MATSAIWNASQSRGSVAAPRLANPLVVPVCCWRNPHLQPKTAFSRLPPVHTADPKGQLRVDSDPPVN
jgi:hypothetical protein